MCNHDHEHNHNHEYEHEHEHSHEHEHGEGGKLVLARIIIAALMLIGLHFVPFGSPVLRLVCYLVPYLLVGYDVLLEAIEGILKGEVFDECFLMAIATVGAVVIAFLRGDSYNEAVFVMLFYQLGEFLTDKAVDKSRHHITELMDIRPDSATVETADGRATVHPDEVEVGSIILVAAGEKVPLDGVVVEGSSMVNTAALTGESVPRSVTVGDEIISGCINENGLLRIKTTKPFGESTVSKILDLVENASEKKAKSEKFITKFAHYYTPAVCAGALALAVIPPLVSMAVGSGAEWGEWVYRALTFLVISCPCALVISIPITFFGGIGSAGRQGVLVKGSSYLEMLSKTKTVVFDKTGTLTEGVFEVQDVEFASEAPERIIELAAHAEAHSSHPISQSIKSAYGGEVDIARISDVNEISGKGVTAKIDGVPVAVGNGRLMDEIGVQYSSTQSCGTAVYVAIDGSFAGCIVINDRIKNTSKSAIRRLRDCGVEKTVMLTGDREKATQSVAKELGVDAVYSELMPADKVQKVEELLEEKQNDGVLAFVGDGINDAPVLMRSDIGIAMGALGSDAAIEAADIVLMDDDPRSIAKAIGISRRCLRIVYENIWFALGVKAVCLILGALGIANMWLAIFADVGVMILAVLNALRCLKKK
ncbi:MAG: cadmium-translocating P-type ATPase [Eubacterium sp.]|nr:cadmium-translocating P-type ATPase [Eubacterium sp.]